jgi:hypothetical protein
VNYCMGLMLSAIVATHPSPRNHKYTIKSIAKNICKYSGYRKLNPYMPLSVIRHESSFNPRLKSKTDDCGLMQINIRWYKVKCNLYKVKCNIKEGTRIMATWRKACLSHDHKDIHWLRHYNWNNKKHHLRVLWLAEAYKRAAEGHTYLYEIIKRRDMYQRIRIKYKCIKEDLCGFLKNH